jgi:hypothetical protein
MMGQRQRALWDKVGISDVRSICFLEIVIEIWCWAVVFDVVCKMVEKRASK